MIGFFLFFGNAGYDQFSFNLSKGSGYLLSWNLSSYDSTAEFSSLNYMENFYGNQFEKRLVGDEAISSFWFMINQTKKNFKQIGPRFDQSKAYFLPMVA